MASPHLMHLEQYTLGHDMHLRFFPSQKKDPGNEVGGRGSFYHVKAWKPISIKSIVQMQGDERKVALYVVFTNSLVDWWLFYLTLPTKGKKIVGHAKGDATICIRFKINQAGWISHFDHFAQILK